MNAFSPQVCVHLRTNVAETGLREADATVKKLGIIGIRLPRPVNTLLLGSRFKPFAPNPVIISLNVKI